MKKYIVVSVVIAGIIAVTTSLNSCKTSAVITSKSGAQIWGETCIRCHNAADPGTFSDVEWDVAAMHMQIRANLTPEETKKVIEFLQSAN
jgi:mono/diheme cytochrome c family protein